MKTHDLIACAAAIAVAFWLGWSSGQLVALRQAMPQFISTLRTMSELGYVYGSNGSTKEQLDKVVERCIQSASAEAK